MIRGSVSWFVSSDKDVEVIKGLTSGYKVNVQLAFYEKKDLVFTEKCIPHKNRISSIHLPKHLTRQDYLEGGIVDNLRQQFDVDFFVVHPWADDLDRIVDVVVEREMYCLCLETFKVSKKGGRNALDLLAMYGRQFITPFVGMCVDFSHIETSVLSVEFLKGLLPYTKMIHLSTRREGVQHLPVDLKKTDFHAPTLITELLKSKNNPIREVVLEYAKEYYKTQIRDIFWLNDAIIRLRRRFGTEEEKEATWRNKK